MFARQESEIPFRQPFGISRTDKILIWGLHINCWSRPAEIPSKSLRTLFWIVLRGPQTVLHKIAHALGSLPILFEDHFFEGFSTWNSRLPARMGDCERLREPQTEHQNPSGSYCCNLSATSRLRGNTPKNFSPREAKLSQEIRERAKYEQKRITERGERSKTVSESAKSLPGRL